MKQVVIREARQADADSLLHLFSHLHPEDSRQEKSLPVSILRNPDRHLLVAEVGGSVVGTIDLVVVSNITRGGKPWAICENLVVLPEFRGQGVASSLLERAREIASERGCYKIQGISSEKREEAKSLYQGLDGLLPANGWKVYLEQ